MYVCKESVHVRCWIVLGQSGLEGLESGSLWPILGQAVSVSCDSQELRELSPVSSAAGHGIREVMSVSGSSAVSSDQIMMMALIEICKNGASASGL